MRIDNSLLITGDNRTETGDMLSRLETGDVIRAKVLEISPRDAVLRLSDGTVIKAATKEPLDVKPGQTISLTVTSRNENSFVLETVKSASRTIAADMGKMQKMLEAAGITADDLNLKLAAEFLKYGTAPTAENISEALGSMKGPGGLDIEKAVYLAVKNISTSQSDKDMLSSLLNGNLKLGQLLESLYKVLNNADKGAEAGNQSTEAGQTAQGSLADTGGKTAVQTGHSASEAADGRSAPQTGHSAPEVTVNTSNAAGNSNLTLVSSDSETKPSAIPSEAQNISDTDQIASNQTKQNGTAEVRQSDQASSIDTEGKSSAAPKSGIKENVKTDTYTKPNTAPDEEGTNPVISKQSDTMTKSASAAKSDVKVTAGDLNSGEIVPVIQDGSMDAVNGAKKSAIGSAEMKHVGEHSHEDTLESINKSIDKIFVNIHKQLSGEELDTGSIRDRLTELSKELKQLIQSPAGSGTVNTKAFSALNLVEDTVKLLDIFNSNNVLYYQIPIKNDSYRSTAELYVMKRQKNKKRIDPNDSVLFLSLDTKNLGRFETILDVKGRNISMSLRTESQAVSDFTRANIKNLYTALSECGYMLTDIKYSIIGAAATPAQQEKLLTDAVRMKHGKVDLRI